MLMLWLVLMERPELADLQTVGQGRRRSYGCDCGVKAPTSGKTYRCVHHCPVVECKYIYLSTTQGTCTLAEHWFTFSVLHFDTFGTFIHTYKYFYFKYHF